MSLRILFLFLTVCLSTQAQLHVAADTRIYLTSANLLYLQDNLSNSGTIDHLTINGSNAQTISGTGNLGSLVINKTSGSATDKTVIISAGAGHMQSLTGLLTLTSGTLVTNGNLTLKSSASGTSQVAEHTTAGTITGNVIVERFIPGSRKKQWRMLGFPFSSALSVADIGGIGKSFSPDPQSLMIFHESGDNRVYGTTGTRNAGYQTLASNGSIPVGKGVAAWLFGPSNGNALTGSDLPGSGLTIISQGSLNEGGGDITFSTAEGVTNTVKGWNLVSNPFASTIDWHAVVPASPNLASTVYRWDPQLEAWSSYNSVGFIATGVGSRYIESGSAIFVKAADEGAAGNNLLTVVFPQSAKINQTPTNAYFSAASWKIDGIPQRVVNIKPRLAGIRAKVSGMGNPLPVDAYLDLSRSDATSGWDPRYDGLMMSRSAGANVYFLGDGGTGYSMHFDAAIQPGEKRYYPVGVTTPQVGQTTLELEAEGAWNPLNSVSLIDTKERRTVLMQGGKLIYPFRMDSLKNEVRFLLAINHVAVDGASGVPGKQLKILGNPVTTDRIDLLLAHPTARPQRWELRAMNGSRVAGGQFTPTDGHVQYLLQAQGMRAAGMYSLRVEMDNGEVETVQVLRK